MAPHRNRCPGAQPSREAALEADHLVLDQRHAVPAGLRPSGGQKVRGRHAVPRQEPLHVGCRCVARLPGIDDSNPSPRSAEDQCRAQASRYPTDDDRVVVLGLLHRHARAPIQGSPGTVTKRFQT